MKALHIGSTTEWLMQCPNTPLLIARSPVRTERILMCIDGSTHADAAVELLTHFPWIDATNISVLSVIEADNDVRASVEAAALRLEATGAKVEIRIVSPDPESITTNARTSILEVSEQLQPDLIVMGTRGLTGLPRLRVGSVASAIARHSGSSVLLVRDLHEDDQGGVSLEGP
jgi:nucleotide-binding universal stress UspA family protein